jgi:hypothetical protein
MIDARPLQSGGQAPGYERVEIKKKNPVAVRE